ncbi:MAG: nucleotidyltransferase domain-containing protein [Methanobrevibacter sp.]|nr:nucleotidyltransferase domain-containing protein [Methanobrevibacter sp.]
MDRLKIAQDFAQSIDFPEVDLIILYGSVARYEDTNDSDIDILIVSSDKDKIIDKVYSKVVDFFLDSGEDISAKILSHGDYDRVKDTHFICTVEKEGIVLG